MGFIQALPEIILGVLVCALIAMTVYDTIVDNRKLSDEEKHRQKKKGRKSK